MADKSKFVGDFRAAIVAMTNAYYRVAELAALPTTLGWQEADFTTALTGSDISPADLSDALTACGALATTFGTESQKLAKLLP